MACTNLTTTDRPHHRPVALLLLALLFWLGPMAPTAAQEVVTRTPMTVAAVLNPPFVRNVTGGELAGLSADMLRAVAQQLGWQLTFKIMTIDAAEAALEKHEVALIVGAISPTAAGQAKFDYSVSYLHPSVAILSKRHQAVDLARIVSHVREPAILHFLGFIGIALLVSALAIWLAERRRNPEHFGGKVRHGIGAGLWWSSVTLTGVGYGDTVPRTTTGRIIAIAWMLISLVLIAVFTGIITTALALGERGTNYANLNDLREARVAIQTGAYAETLLDQLNLDYTGYPTLRAAVQAIHQGNVDAVVGFEVELRDMVNAGPFEPYIVVPQFIERHGIVFAIRPDWPQRRALDEAILKTLQTDLWHNAVREIEQGTARRTASGH